MVKFRGAGQGPRALIAELTRQNDLNFKRGLHESEGVPTYLVIDPESAEVTCHRLRDGRKKVSGTVSGDMSTVTRHKVPDTFLFSAQRMAERC